MRLKNKVALVTGATSGIGKAIAERYAAEGAHVAVNFLPRGTSAETAEQIARGFPTRGIAVGADVSRREEVERMVEKVVEEFGTLDIAVNNAGIEIRAPFLAMTDEEWRRVIDVNLYGAFVVSQAAAQIMVRAGRGGAIINISSTHEDIPFPGHTSYCCAKGGLRMLTRNAAVELAPHGIRINNIAPGAIATPINAAVLSDPEAKRNATREIPLGRFGRPEEVAAVAVFLASAEAEYVTGSTYYIDGGLSQQVTRY